MTDMTAAVQLPTRVGVAPTYTQCTVADKFTAAPNARYMLHYKNGATPTGIIKYTDPTTPIPVGSTAAAGFADVQMSAAQGATTERVVWIDNSTQFRDATGAINMVHATPTTLTVAIFGPF